MSSDANLPIELLIRSRMLELGLSEWELAQACGYKSVSGGLRAVRKTLATGKVHPFLAPGLPTALGIDQATFDQAIAETDWILAVRAVEAADRAERKYRNQFCPYVWARFEFGNPKPNTIVVLAGIYAATYAFVPAITSDPPAAKERTSRDVLQWHYRRWGPSMPVYGQIAGYYEVIEPARNPGTDLAVLRDTEGNVVNATLSIERPQFLLKRKSSDALSSWINDLDALGKPGS